MKLRIRGNSLRLRLGRSEVDELASSGIVEDRAFFGPAPANVLAYKIRLADTDDIRATFSDGCIEVHVPAKIGNAWAANEEVGLSSSQQNPDGSDLSILIEKDFVCLTPRANEDETDAFPHPKGSAAC